MHPRIVRHLISPLLERMLGRRTFEFARECDAAQWQSPDELRAMQRDKLRSLLNLAQSNCTWYQNLFAELGLDATTDDPFAMLEALPCIDKETIRANQSDMTNASVEGGPIPFNTGGSTGEPLSFVVDRRRIAYDKAARIMTHAWYGVQHGDREVYLWGSPLEIRGQDRFKHLRDRLTNELLLAAFRLNPETMSQYHRQINAFDPASIFGYPSSLTRFAEFCEKSNRRYGGGNLKAVFVTGEVIDDRQREVLSRYFNVPIVNGYGSRDGGFIAHECTSGNMHVMDQNVIVEILDETGQPAPEGECGEIVITHLDAHALPLIRYQTGDMAENRSGQCACGRGLSLIGAIDGRRGDHLVGADGTLTHPLAAIYVMRELESVRQFQIHQQRDRSINVKVVEAGIANPVNCERIVSDLRRRLGPLPVNIQTVGEIPVAGSGKYRHVVSEATSEFNTVGSV
ncbi:MAG: capsular polysaccharide biosynthesis protein [Phycisphaerae bacterium]|nr:MAG: capsular polysaccharide biosynthesis protein [Phycisphaerae bacterium]